MKQKLIQILLGAIGSAITVVVTHFAGATADAAVGAAMAAGPVTTLVSAKVGALASIFRA